MATAPPERAPKKGLNIYGCASVNPVKLVIAAEELGYVLDTSVLTHGIKVPY